MNKGKTPEKLSSLFDSSSESSRAQSPHPRLKPLTSPMKTPLRESDYYLSPSLPASPFTRRAQARAAKISKAQKIMRIIPLSFFLLISLMLFVYTVRALFLARNNSAICKSIFTNETTTTQSEFCHVLIDYDGSNFTEPKTRYNDIDAKEAVKCCPNIAVADDIVFYKLSTKTELIISVISLVYFTYLLVRIFI